MSHLSLNRIDHRPWELPEKPWKWRQSWCDLLFAHWPVEATQIRKLVPEPLVVQEFDGISWLGVVPFRMEGVMHRPLPDLPRISAFPELNVRFYVEHEGKPGVWFFSLDATNILAVKAARKFFHLPYFKAKIKIQEIDDTFEFQSQRQEGADLRFEAVYRPCSNPYEAQPDTLEYWLTERYCLYSQDNKGNLYRAEVHHVPWPLQKTEADIRVNQMLSPFGIELGPQPAHLHFAKRVDVIVWPLQQLAV